MKATTTRYNWDNNIMHFVPCKQPDTFISNFSYLYHGQQKVITGILTQIPWKTPLYLLLIPLREMDTLKWYSMVCDLPCCGKKAISENHYLVYFRLCNRIQKFPKCIRAMQFDLMLSEIWTESLNQIGHLLIKFLNWIFMQAYSFSLHVAFFWTKQLCLGFRVSCAM